MPRERDCADVNLAETDPWKNDGSGNEDVKPEGGIVFACMGQGFTRLAVVVNKEDNLGPDQSQGGPSEETVGPLKTIVKLHTYVGVGKDNHHQQYT